MLQKFQNPYNPIDTESRIYKYWEESGFFNPDKLPSKRSYTFSTLMPPPNANGRLHVGHALDLTLKDILTRFHRMRGASALFVPGADHAGFETQMVFEKKLAKEGLSRFGMDQKFLYDKIFEFTMENMSHMENDIRRLGISCDWSRKIFTLDKGIIAKVQQTFIDMYREEQVYRGARIIHWNPKYQTALSDIETEFIEQTDPFYYLQYGPFVIGTVRPETKFGDKYVVMHPKDSRYNVYKHGDKIDLEWINGPVSATIIKDEAVDMEFGSGVMTITPWHDATDFEIAGRHGLDREQIIDFRGRLLSSAGEFEGMKIAEARPKIVQKLESKGLLVKIDAQYKHNVRICERTKVPIEPQIKEQWFIKMRPLAEKVIEAVAQQHSIKFLPAHQEKILLHWMNNTIDWNISRQIVWGIPIPAWYKGEQIHVGHSPPNQEGWQKDTDTFDTWFSSGQWPLLALGWPNSDDFKTYYPTDIMETGSDLVFKWVPRMIMFSLLKTGKVPFNTVYFHGMVNDAHNKKMSKSKGNVVSPIDMSDKYGTDALRMALTVGNTPGGSLALSEDRIKGYKHFANKVWNATRFVLENTENLSDTERPNLSDQDLVAIAELNATAREITENTESYQLHLAAEKIYHYFWHTFADVIIETAKSRLKNADNPPDVLSAKWTLLEILKTCLKLLHPFMPFITEEIWQNMQSKSKLENMLMIETWPI